MKTDLVEKDWHHGIVYYYDSVKQKFCTFVFDSKLRCNILYYTSSERSMRSFITRNINNSVADRFIF